MEVYNGSQFNLNCTNFTVEDLKFFNRLRNITAILCSVITLAILIFLIFNKTFSSLLKRLCFYLILGTLVTEIIIGLNIEHLWYYEGQETICSLLGFLTQWSYVMVFILSYEIILHLFCTVIVKSQQCSNCTGSKCCTRTVEFVYIILPMIIATIFAVVPLENNSYGVAGPWCWVQSLNSKCEHVGLVTQVVFYAMYVAVGVVDIGASLIFFIIYCKLPSALNDTARSLLKQTVYVMIFQIIHILICTCNLSLRVYTLFSQRHQLYFLWVAHAFTIPIGVFLFPVGYLITFYPVKQKVLKIFNKIVGKCCKSKHEQYTEMQHHKPELATAPMSDRVTQPSETYCNISHPDDYSEQSSLIPEKAT